MLKIRGRVPTVARLDEQAHIRVHEWRRHADVRAVGQHELRVVPELFDEAEDVVPASTVQPCMKAQSTAQCLLHSLEVFF